ncbi:hypothetical protein [Corynebacterium propinquum]|uniref:hypothetical protein n=1 Tax=Corynebacterium propinquum TaxID=43769 RepID=UPI003CE4D854
MNGIVFLTEIGASDMPVIIPALDKTLAANIQHAAQRYFDAGEQKVVIPVCNDNKQNDTFELSVLILSDQDAPGFWSLNQLEFPEHATMAQIVEAVAPDKQWKFDTPHTDKRQEFQNLIGSA